MCSPLQQRDVDEFTDLYLGLHHLTTKNLCPDMDCFSSKLRTQQLYREDRFWQLLLLYLYFGYLQQGVYSPLRTVIFSRLLLKCRRTRRGERQNQQWYHAYQRGPLFPTSPTFTADTDAPPSTGRTPRSLTQADVHDTEVVLVEFGEDVDHAAHPDQHWPWMFHLALLVRLGEKIVLVPLSDAGKDLLEELPLPLLGNIFGRGPWPPSDRGECKPQLTPVRNMYCALLWLHVALVKERPHRSPATSLRDGRTPHVSVVNTFSGSESMKSDRGAALFEVHLVDSLIEIPGAGDDPGSAYQRCVPAALRWRHENALHKVVYSLLE
jgi:hypothetical protein